LSKRGGSDQKRLRKALRAERQEPFSLALGLDAFEVAQELLVDVAGPDLQARDAQFV
jgi:hypothetical protein